MRWGDIPARAGIVIFVALFATFWVVPNNSDLGSNNIRCYDFFRDQPENSNPEAKPALWPPGGKCVLETEKGRTLERPRGTPLFLWLASGIFAAGVTVALSVISSAARFARRRRV